ncbi:MAG TPA: YggS family pyridoxal phosphate-dependent enzyme [Bacillota bacterium]|nr:YggS family pyridoxal phosphate-dependent enzyme [Bacillota bacterium]
MDIQQNLEQIREKIRQACEKTNRNPDEITIIGVTKYVTIERAKALVDLGITNLGENRSDGFLQKYEKIEKDATWHFIGTLQSRKVKDVIDYVDYLHSLDRKSLAKEVNKRAKRPIPCFVQVNVSGEETKHGLAPEEVIPFIEEMEQFPNVHIIGLMTMAPHTDNEGEIRQVFRKLRQLRDEIMEKGFQYAPCKFLSMGMSNDYEIAIEEGATHIRLGSTLVGNEWK